ncbi:nuclease-related domain-containing protein [Nocardioides sp. SYSU D00065]|uniref:nuclease-related domain-containing protein n=1 Tax=Nocardioides sp. SYSU D00065 TaxID=2817378 RepID=UPI001B33F9B9|nr:nuclease-related domain-containing protein [Nocardioides sp. SYSU D00065]
MVGDSAGRSAHDVARRQRERAERLQRSAALWEQGAEGEVAVARALEALPEGWVALHDLPWPGRQRANLDHVVVGPGGVFVVDAKNWSGRIEVRDQVLTQNGRRREEAVAGAAEAAITLQSIVSVSHSCTGVLCFVRDEPMTGWARGVMVCSTSNLTTMLTSRPPVLGADDVRACVEAIRAGAQRTMRTTVSRSERRTTKRRGGRPVAVLVGGLALLAAIASGGLQDAADWAGRQFAGVIVPGEPEQPVAPSDRDERNKKDKQKRIDQQRQ